MKRARLSFSFPDHWDTLLLPADTAHHLVRVLRVAVGDSCELVDQKGRCILVTLEPPCKGLQPKQEETWSVRYVEERVQETEPPYQVHLVQSLPKGEKLEWILQKGVELGVTDFYLPATERTQYPLNETQRVKKELRWEKILAAAALQSERGISPRLHSCTHFQNLPWSNWNREDCLALAADPRPEHLSLREVFENYSRSKGLPQAVVLFVGPEGGWSEAERQWFVKQGIPLIRFGPRVLRTETAGMALLAALSYSFEVA